MKTPLVSPLLLLKTEYVLDTRRQAKGAGQHARDVTFFDPRPALILGPDVCGRGESARGTNSPTRVAHANKHTHMSWLTQCSASTRSHLALQAGSRVM